MAPVTRRGFLQLTGGALAAPLLGLSACDESNPWRDEEVADLATFPIGVLAGDATPTGITLLIQVGSLLGSRRLGLDVAEDPLLLRSVYRAAIDLPQDVEAVPLKLTLPAALRPGATYYYRLSSRTARSPLGRFRTLRDPDDASPVRLACFSCQGYPAGYYTAHAGLAAERDLDLALCVGDYIYDWTNDDGPPDRADPIGASAPGVAETVADYRAKYRLYRGDADLQAMHAAHSFLAVWDNHDLADPLPQFPLHVSTEERRHNGRVAFWDYMPMRPGPAERPLYRSLRLGALCELFLLDLHTHADKPRTGGSYLGAAQRRWLLGGLKASTARWKIVATSTVMMSMQVAPGSPLAPYSWDGYPEERRLLVEELRAAGVEGVVALSGDLHTFLAAPVTTTGSADGEAGLVEVCCGSISSQGLLNLTPDQVDLARRLEETARQRNPHLRFIDVLDRGYGVIEAGPDELTITLRSPETVYEPTSAMKTLATLRVRHGRNEIEVL